MLKVLITGSEGFVGQNFIKAFKDQFEIIGLIRTSFPEKADGVKYFKGDILDKKFLEELFSKEKPDVILHLAGISVTWSENLEEIFQVNLIGTLNIYEVISKLKKDSGFDPKIIFASSSQIYSKTKNPENITEEGEIKPTNFYGTSKAAADRLSFQYSESGLKIVILRPFAHTGPGQKPGFFVPDMCSQIVEIENGKSQELLVGNLEAIRDYLDVRDVIEVYKYFAENDFEPGEVFNICSSQGYKMADLLNMLLKFSTKQITPKVDPGRVRKVEVPIHVGNNKKLTIFSGWEPKIKIEQTLKDTLDYYRNIS